MSESDSFIREVSEEVDRDRMNRQLKRWGPWIGAGALALVGLAAAWQWQQDQDRQAAEEIGSILLSEDLADPDRAGDARSLLSGPPAALADFRQAEAAVAAGDLVAAIDLYRQIAGRGDIDAAYTDLAALRAARLAAVSEAPEAVMRDLEPLMAPGRPYRLLARELRAILMLNRGDTDAAHQELRAILADPALPRGLQARAIDLLRASGAETLTTLGAEGGVAAPTGGVNQ
ncbi:MAG: hypothetical protein AAFR17_04455 [Pseudomonadota bacterium]